MLFPVPHLSPYPKLLPFVFAVLRKGVKSTLNTDVRLALASGIWVDVIMCQF